jgi:hypothetical protein
MITIYENGVQIGAGGVGKPPAAGASEVHLGGWQGNASELLDGILDEVGLFLASEKCIVRPSKIQALASSVY